MPRSSPPAVPRARVAELVIEHAKDYAIFTMDLDGRVATWSGGAEQITGYSEPEALGMDFAVLFTASDRAADQPRTELEKAWREGRAEDTRWHLHRNGERFWANGVTTAFKEGDQQGLIKVMRDETRARLADEQRVLLLNELNHRINNTLVTVQSLVDQTLRSRSVDPATRDDIAARLVALSEAHDLLVAENWAGADLQAVVEKAFAPYERADPPRLRAAGPSVRLSPQQAVSMALILHELATNSVKYGALLARDGYVAVTWNLHIDEVGARHMTLLWEERGGPNVAAPTRRGFGSRLIERSFGGATNGHAIIEFAASGVRCAIDMPLTTLEETAMLDLGLDHDRP